MFYYMVNMKDVKLVPQLVMLAYLLLVGGGALYIYYIKDFVWKLIKVNYYKLSVTYHLYLLKRFLDSKQTLVLTEVLLKIFHIYLREKEPSINIELLFPKNNLLNESQLTKYQCKMKEKLTPYYKLYQNIQIYNEGRINIDELVRRMK